MPVKLAVELSEEVLEPDEKIFLYASLDFFWSIRFSAFMSVTRTANGTFCPFVPVEWTNTIQCSRKRKEKKGV